MPRFVPSRPDPGGDPAYAALKARIIARTGHHYYIDKDELLTERLHRRFRATAIAEGALSDLDGFESMSAGHAWLVLGVVRHRMLA